MGGAKSENKRVAAAHENDKNDTENELKKSRIEQDSSKLAANKRAV